MIDLPIEFVQKYQELLGKEESEKFFAAIKNKTNKKGFRLNSLKYNYQQVRYDLSKPVALINDGYYGAISGKDSEWVSGYVYSQDPSAMYPAYFLNVKAGERVLDLCAAPGGKSTEIAQVLANSGILVANEISEVRVKNLRENLEKWGASNVVITNESSDHLADKFNNYFDRIIVDAPCSGEGMFRKDPDAITYWSQDYVLTCQKRQKEILAEAVKMLKPGGYLVYSTCTYAPEEDEQIVAWLTENFKFEIQDLPIQAGMSKGRPEWTTSKDLNLAKTRRFWFQDGVGEGQFAALLRKNEAENEDQPTKRRKKKAKKQSIKQAQRLNIKQQELIERVIQKFDLPDQLLSWPKKALVSNDHVFIPAIPPEDLSQLRVFNNGVELGLLKKNRFEPGHQLAEVLGQKSQKEVLNLATEADYQKYLHGETIKVNSELRGFVLVAFNNQIFSFGKIGGDSILKNYYPKGYANREVIFLTAKLEAKIF